MSVPISRFFQPKNKTTVDTQHVSKKGIDEEIIVIDDDDDEVDENDIVRIDTHASKEEDVMIDISDNDDNVIIYSNNEPTNAVEPRNGSTICSEIDECCYKNFDDSVIDTNNNSNSLNNNIPNASTLQNNDTILDASNTKEQNNSKNTSSGGNPMNNIFAKFAFGGRPVPVNQPKMQRDDKETISTSTNLIKSNNWNDNLRHNTKSINRSSDTGAKKRKQPSSTSSSNKECDFIPIRNLPEIERNKIMMKWHSLIDPNASTIEEKRFQVLTAARLHARCQEVTVRKALITLYKRLGPITVQRVAQLDPTVLSECLTTLQFYNTKAKQIIQAANEIITLFNGIVPETVIELKQITGIGPVFADLLAYVNTYDAHTQSNNDNDDENINNNTT